MTKRANKDDGHARERWGAAYDAIPKSVFATLAFEALADLDGLIDVPEILDRAAAELALLERRVIPARQARHAKAAVTNARTALRHALMQRARATPRATVPA